MHTFVHLFRIVFLRSCMLALSVFFFVIILGRVHDYSQTRQAIANYHSNDGLMWVIVFYLLNEAGSGIKFALLDDQKYLIHYPRKDNAAGGRDSRNDFELALLNSQKGDWREQLHLSHLIALGWGAEVNKAEALKWYEESKRVAEVNGEAEEWQSHSRRQVVRVLLIEEIRSKELSMLIDDIWIESVNDNNRILLRAGEIG